MFRLSIIKRGNSMKIARRFLALLTALLMVFSLLAACGNGEGDDNTSSDALDYLEGSSSNQKISEISYRTIR